MDALRPRADYWSTLSLAHPVGIEDDGRVVLSAVELGGRRLQPDQADDLKTSARLLNERRPEGYLVPLSCDADATPRCFSHLLRVEAADWTAPRDWAVVFARRDAPRRYVVGASSCR